MNKKLLIAGLIIIALVGLALNITSKELARELRFVVPFETISQGSYSGHPERASYVIDNQEDWQELWQKITAKTFPQPPLPEIDFGNHMLLARFMGQRTSGGYVVQFIIILEEEEKIKAVALEVSPGPGCIVTQAITEPYQMIQIPRTGKEIRFTIKEATRRCLS